MQSLNECKFSLVLPVEIFGIWGLAIYRWKGLEHMFPIVYYTSQKGLNCSHKTKKKKLSSFWHSLSTNVKGG